MELEFTFEKNHVLSSGKVHKSLKMAPIPFKFDRKGLYRYLLWRFTNRHWILTDDFIFYCDHLQKWIKIPKGFVFDGASIPKILHSVMNPTDGVLYGSIVHDFIYRFDQLILCNTDSFVEEAVWYLKENITRKVADDLLRDVSMQFDDIPNGSAVAKFVIKPTGIFAWKRSRKRGYKLDTPNPDFYNIHLQKGFNVTL